MQNAEAFAFFDAIAEGEGIKYETAGALGKGERIFSAAKAVAAVGRKYVECNIENYRRLSTAFKSREACGKIDLLCVLPMSKTAFVFDCKNLVKTHGLYQAKRNTQDFFTSKDSYYDLLLRKKEFIWKNLSVVLTVEKFEPTI